MNTLTAKDLMTSPVISVNQNTPVSDLTRLLNDEGISGVPVVDDDGSLVGVISITDLLAANVGEDEIGQADFHTSPSMDGLTRINPLLEPDKDIETHPVSDLMSRKTITADASCPIGTLSKTLVTNRIHRIVIIQDNLPIGIVSVGDILRTLGGYSDT